MALYVSPRKQEVPRKLDKTQTSWVIGDDGYDDIHMLRVTHQYCATIWHQKEWLFHPSLLSKKELFYWSCDLAGGVRGPSSPLVAIFNSYFHMEYFAADFAISPRSTQLSFRWNRLGRLLPVYHVTAHHFYQEIDLMVLQQQFIIFIRVSLIKIVCVCLK